MATVFEYLFMCARLYGKHFIRDKKLLSAWMR